MLRNENANHEHTSSTANKGLCCLDYEQYKYKVYGGALVGVLVGNGKRTFGGSKSFSFRGRIRRNLDEISVGALTCQCFDRNFRSIPCPTVESWLTNSTNPTDGRDKNLSTCGPALSCGFGCANSLSLARARLCLSYCTTVPRLYECLYCIVGINYPISSYKPYPVDTLLIAAVAVKATASSASASC